MSSQEMQYQLHLQSPSATPVSTEDPEDAGWQALLSLAEAATAAEDDEWGRRRYSRHRDEGLQDSEGELRGVLATKKAHKQAAPVKRRRVNPVSPAQTVPSVPYHHGSDSLGSSDHSHLSSQQPQCSIQNQHLAPTAPGCYGSWPLMPSLPMALSLGLNHPGSSQPMQYPRQPSISGATQPAAPAIGLPVACMGYGSPLAMCLSMSALCRLGTAATPVVTNPSACSTFLQPAALYNQMAQVERVRQAFQQQAVQGITAGPFSGSMGSAPNHSAATSQQASQYPHLSPTPTSLQCPKPGDTPMSPIPTARSVQVSPTLPAPAFHSAGTVQAAFSTSTQAAPAPAMPTSAAPPLISPTQGFPATPSHGLPASASHRVPTALAPAVGVPYGLPPNLPPTMRDALLRWTAFVAAQQPVLPGVVGGMRPGGGGMLPGLGVWPPTNLGMAMQGMPQYRKSAAAAPHLLTGPGFPRGSSL